MSILTASKQTTEDFMHKNIPVQSLSVQLNKEAIPIHLYLVACYCGLLSVPHLYFVIQTITVPTKILKISRMYRSRYGYGIKLFAVS